MHSQIVFALAFVAAFMSMCGASTEEDHQFTCNLAARNPWPSSLMGTFTSAIFYCNLHLFSYISAPLATAQTFGECRVHATFRSSLTSDKNTIDVLVLLLY
jgi:hypothetical protein